MINFFRRQNSDAVIISFSPVFVLGNNSNSLQDPVFSLEMSRTAGGYYELHLCLKDKTLAQRFIEQAGFPADNLRGDKTSVRLRRFLPRNLDDAHAQLEKEVNLLKTQYGLEVSINPLKFQIGQDMENKTRTIASR